LRAGFVAHEYGLESVEPRVEALRLNENLKRIAELADIDKPLSMHIAGEKIPVQMLQKLYRHSSIQTTIGYQANFIYKESDDAIDAVTNF
jgi:hypothetical protein